MEDANGLSRGLEPVVSLRSRQEWAVLYRDFTGSSSAFDGVEVNLEWPTGDLSDTYRSAIVILRRTRGDRDHPPQIDQ
jgi:hypothetical protein